MSEKIIALVPAAGIGARARRQSKAAILKPDLPKQYELLHGLPMLRLSTMAMLADSRIQQVRVIVSPTDTRAEGVLVGLDKTICRPVGGETRADTVYNALVDLQPTADMWVVVHDAARPGLPADALERLISTCLEHNQGGILATPVPDTLKRAQAGTQPLQIEQTVPRDQLWLAQTPQMFKATQLLHALELVREQQLSITDEASAIEQLGIQPLLVRGAVENFKITWPEDFSILERLL